MSEKIVQVDRIWDSWQGGEYVCYVSFWYYLYGVKCQNVREFSDFKAAAAFRDELRTLMSGCKGASRLFK